MHASRIFRVEKKKKTQQPSKKRENKCFKKFSIRTFGSVMFNRHDKREKCQAGVMRKDFR